MCLGTTKLILSSYFSEFYKRENFITCAVRMNHDPLLGL